MGQHLRRNYSQGIKPQRFTISHQTSIKNVNKTEKLCAHVSTIRENRRCITSHDCMIFFSRSFSFHSRQSYISSLHIRRWFASQFRKRIKKLSLEIQRKSRDLLVNYTRSSASNLIAIKESNSQSSRCNEASSVCEKPDSEIKYSLNANRESTERKVLRRDHLWWCAGRIWYEIWNFFFIKSFSCINLTIRWSQWVLYCLL